MDLLQVTIRVMRSPSVMALPERLRWPHVKLFASAMAGHHFRWDGTLLKPTTECEFVSRSDFQELVLLGLVRVCDDGQLEFYADDDEEAA